MITLILESALRTFVLAAAAWTALRLLRVTNVVAQKIAWTIVLAAALVMPWVVRQHWVKLPAIAIPASWTAHARAAAPPALYQPAPAQHSALKQRTAAPVVDIAIPNVAISESSTSPAPTSSASVATSAPRHWTFPPLRSLIVPAYLAVVAVLLLRLLVGLALSFRVWYRAEPASVLVDPRADVRFSEDLRTPVTIGLGIILPKAFQQWPRKQLHVVLAHERAHVRQADFYLQLFARLHTAIFWFSPAAWWIQKHLSDLGEAISDYAAITEASDAPSYAELLLEVAAIKRQPLFAVPMARSSRIERRIDRILTDGLFRRSFVEHKGRALAVAAVLPVILAVSSSLLAVRAAEVVPVVPAIHVIAQEALPLTTTPPTPEPAAVPSTRIFVPDTQSAISNAPLPVIPVPPPATVKLDAAPPIPVAEAYAPAIPQDTDSYSSDSRGDSFMLVVGDQHHTFNNQGDDSEMRSFRNKLHGNYLLAERGGKYYVIDDTSIVAQSQKLIEPMEELGRQQEALGAKQEKLGEQQEKLGKQQEEAHIETPDMSKEIAQLQVALQKLQSLEKSKSVTQQELADVQESIAGIEGHLGEMQGEIGAKQGDLGRQQGELGRQQGELGRQQGELGRQQGRIARQASRQINSMIDQALKDGKAKPVQ